MEEFENDGIITLRTTWGENIDFVEIAGIAYSGNFYVILQPLALIDGMSDDEAVMFKVTRENGEEKFLMELDGEIIDAVCAKYNRLLVESED